MAAQRRKRIETKECDFEWHAILRVPKSKVAALEEIMESQIPEEDEEEEMISEKPVIKPGGSLLGINFEKTLLGGQFRIKDDIIGFSVQDLPCIVETYKTHNNVDLYKIANVSQILLCNDNSENLPSMDDTNEAEDSNAAQPSSAPLPSNVKQELAKLKLGRYPHGLTPPMKNVTKCRFRKTKKTKYIDAPQIEQQLRGIFRRDMEAHKIEFQLVDDEENRLDTEEEPILPIIENANPFKRVIKSLPLPQPLQAQPESQPQPPN
uniref:TAFII55 protein conserved region domain-containing protein n=1 Tax=Panagrolaimus sp. ES5 TaxID=591445 RepID=A0AC34GV37_9BILA